MVKPPSFEVIAGTYEEFLVGYNYSSTDKSLTQSFAAHDHSASIRCVTFSGHYVASGGTDDRIYIYDLNTRKLHFTLTHHDATVNCVQFTENNSHVISGSSDGVLAIVRVGNWQVEKLWEKAHKGASVLDIAVHSSGKLALTLGADCTLCTWNLVKGRQAYVINLRSKCKDPKSVEKILWAPDGVRFLLFGGKWTEIWSIESGGVLKQTEHKERVTASVWFNDDTLVLGHENGDVSTLEIDNENVETVKGHDSRIKSIAFYKKKFVTVASNGELKVWNKSLQELASINTGCRLTCLCVVPQLKVKEEKTIEENVVEVVETTEKEKIQKPKVVVIEEEDEDQEKKSKRSFKESGKKGKKKKKKLS